MLSSIYQYTFDNVLKMLMGVNKQQCKITQRYYKGLFIIWVLHDTRKIRLFDQIKDSREKPNQLDKWLNIFERRPFNTEQAAGMNRACI